MSLDRYAAIVLALLEKTQASDLDQLFEKEKWRVKLEALTVERDLFRAELTASVGERFKLAEENMCLIAERDRLRETLAWYSQPDDIEAAIERVRLAKQ